MGLKALLSGLRGAVQGASYRSPEHLRYAEILESAVGDGVLTKDEIAVITEAKSAADGKIPDTKKKEIFGKLVDAILSGDRLVQDHIDSVKWLAATLQVPSDVAAGAMHSLGLAERCRSILDGEFGHVDVGGTRLQKSEIACLSIGASLMGIKKRREYVGGSRGVSFRIAKGVSYRVGAHKGHSETVEESIIEATGDLIVTSKRLIFVSPKRTVTIRMEKIVNLEMFRDGAMIHSESRQKPYLFVFANDDDGSLFGAAMDWAEQQ